MLATVVPRVSGDGSVTLAVAKSGPRQVDEEAVPAELSSLCRVSTGMAVLLLPRPRGVGLILAVREVMPASATARKIARH